MPLQKKSEANKTTTKRPISSMQLRATKERFEYLWAKARRQYQEIQSKALKEKVEAKRNEVEKRAKNYLGALESNYGDFLIISKLYGSHYSNSAAERAGYTAVYFQPGICSSELAALEKAEKQYKELQQQICDSTENTKFDDVWSEVQVKLVFADPDEIVTILDNAIKRIYKIT